MIVITRERTQCSERGTFFHADGARLATSNMKQVPRSLPAALPREDNPRHSSVSEPVLIPERSEERTTSGAVEKRNRAMKGMLEE